MKSDKSLDDTHLNDCVKSAIRILTSHDVSSKLLTQKLAKRFDIEHCKQAVCFLENNNYINEEKSAYELGAAYIRKTQKGPAFIRKALLDKLFPESLVDNTINRLFKETSEADTAFKSIQKKILSAQKKFPAHTENRLEKITAYLRAFLGRNGFSQHVSDQVIEEFVASHLEKPETNESDTTLF